MALCAPPGLKLDLASSANDNLLRTKRTTRRNSVILRMAATSDVATYEEGQLERPKWAGETPLSRLVGALISFGPISSVLKFGARQVLISTAEKKNIPWRKMMTEILESDVYKEMESIQNPSIVYPDYYLNPFHAYDEGNLSWLAAAEAEAANMSMTRRAIPNASSLDEAVEVLRGNWLQEIEKHNQLYSRKIEDILDIGCSVGVSTRYLSDFFPSANVTGLDLSPYFLSVAQHKEKRTDRKNPIKWVHANGEDTGLPSQSFDLVSFAYVITRLMEFWKMTDTVSGFPYPVGLRFLYAGLYFMFHECPEKAIIGLLREAFRLLRPGGTVAVTDLAPKSKILQELSPMLFTLFRSTEPFLDEYCLTDLEGRMREVGFDNIQAVLTDPRHMTTTATVTH